MGISINNLKPEKCKDIYPAIASNASDLLKVSELAASNGKFGCATALMILGAEEFAKAIIVLLYAQGVNIFKINEAAKVFRNHKAKHEVASAFELLNLLAPVIKIIELFSESKSKSTYGFVSVITIILKGLSENLFLARDVITNFDWWENADNIKQNGFYVNYNDSLTTPNLITKAEYDNAKGVVERLKSSYRILNILLVRYPDSGNSLVNTLNQGVIIYNTNNNKQITRNGSKH